jgi:hypothetical protein
MMKPELQSCGETAAYTANQSPDVGSPVTSNAATYRTERAGEGTFFDNRESGGLALEGPPTDLLELGLEAECYAALTKSANLDRSQHLDFRSSEVRFAGGVPGRAGDFSAENEISNKPAAPSPFSPNRRRPMASRLSGRYQLMLGILAGMIAAGGAALQWAFEPARTVDRKVSAGAGEQSRNWVLQGPIVLDIPGNESKKGDGR